VASVIAMAATAAPAESRMTSACRFEFAGTGMVRAVVDGRSFALDDGREVRLAAIEVPFLTRTGEDEASVAPGAAARAALEGLLANQVIELRSAAAAADRYGRMLAFVYVTADGAQRSVVHEMVARGFARVSAHVGERACAAELLARERAARQAKLGLWSERYYAILDADSTADLVAQRGHFTVVEGKVSSVRESGGTIYVNFGGRWSQALTVTIAKRQERSFAAAGLEPKKLEHRLLRVRGWIEERNGPRIEVAHPEQIEIADRN
jgi:endonuclease YncB( thermonuclease family)